MKLVVHITSPKAGHDTQTIDLDAAEALAAVEELFAKNTHSIIAVAEEIVHSAQELFARIEALDAKEEVEVFIVPQMVGGQI